MPYYETRDSDDSAWLSHHLRAPAHLHQYLELVVFFEGRSVAFADAERCELSAGDVFMAFPRQVHRYETTGPESSYVFIVDPDLLPELAPYFAGDPPASALLRGAANDGEILHLARSLVETPKPRTPLEEALRHGRMLTLFARVLSLYKRAAPPEQGSRAFRAIVDYCAKNYTKELSLSLLERELHISKYYISHLFSEKLQLGFNDYVNSLRITFACRYLRESDKSVTEISSLVGFGTLRTFNRAFFKQTGKTPSDYRRAAPAETAHISATPPVTEAPVTPGTV